MWGDNRRILPEAIPQLPRQASANPQIFVVRINPQSDRKGSPTTRVPAADYQIIQIPAADQRRLEIGLRVATG